MPLPPETAIDNFFDGQISGDRLLRSFASFEHWLAPAGFRDGIPVLSYLNVDGHRHLFMFTGPERYRVCSDTLGQEVLGEHYLDLTGDSLWIDLSKDDEGFDNASTVTINPYSARAIHYKKDQFPLLRSWARIVRVERALDTVLATSSGFETIKSFPGYYFGFESSDSCAKFLALAPDSKGRKLAAIFTASDAAEAYLAVRGSGAVELARVDGERLFKSLKNMPLDGIVFNCEGPTTPRAFAIAFADKVLDLG